MTSRRSWPRRVLSVVAGAAVLAALAAPSAAVASAGVPAAGTTGTTTGVAQPRVARTTATAIHISSRLAFRASLPYSNILTGAEATSPSDAWAIGATATGDSRAYAVHWNGSAWKITHFPDRAFVPDWVRASSRHNVWFIGSRITSGISVREALRWDGARWHVMAVPQEASGVFRPVVLGPSDVWLSGATTWNRAHGWHTLLWHWNGRAWTSYVLPILADDSLGMSLAGSSDRNLWAAGIAASSPARTATGRLVAYAWNGSAWHRKAMPRVFLAGPPELAVAASGEAWVVGRGTRRVHHKPIILYRIGGQWKRLPDRVLDVPSGVGTPAPDGLNGVWLGLDLYWSGSAVAQINGQGTRNCDSLYLDTQGPFMDGIPRTHSILLAAACQRTSHGRLQGSILIDKPR